MGVGTTVRNRSSKWTIEPITAIDIELATQLASGFNRPAKSLDGRADLALRPTLQQLAGEQALAIQHAYFGKSVEGRMPLGGKNFAGNYELTGGMRFSGIAVRRFDFRGHQCDQERRSNDQHE
jgi:hypothetical protein